MVTGCAGIDGKGGAMQKETTIHGPFDRFLKCQARMYDTALRELVQGRRRTSWICYIFPQLRGLAKNRKDFVFGIVNGSYAKAYLAHPVLGVRLIRCCETLLMHKHKTAEDILGEKGGMKLRSCVTLFSLVSEDGSVFHRVLERFFGGKPDPVTVGLFNGSILDMTYRKFLVGVDFCP